MDYLPFWLGGLALGGVAVWTWVLEGRTLGITAQVTGVVDAATDPAAESEAAEFSKRDPNDIFAALAAATAAETGRQVEAPKHETSPEPSCEASPLATHTPVAQRILFLLFLVLGATAASLLDGSFAIRTDFGSTHNAFVGDGWTRYALVLGGGVAVGFGTRMAGGCTSGHGLTGCARMLPRSVIATCVFLGTAILFTLLTKALT